MSCITAIIVGSVAERLHGKRKENERITYSEFYDKGNFYTGSDFWNLSPDKTDPERNGERTSKTVCDITYYYRKLYYAMDDSDDKNIRIHALYVKKERSWD